MSADCLVAAILLIAGVFATLEALTAGARRTRLKATGRLAVRVAFPLPDRANLSVTFDADHDPGPFAARATVVEGSKLALTRDSVDGLPDGDDLHELVAPMVEAPLAAGNLHRLVGAIGVQRLGARFHGRVRIEIFDRWGRALAAAVSDIEDSAGDARVQKAAGAGGGRRRRLKTAYRPRR